MKSANDPLKNKNFEIVFKIFLIKPLVHVSETLYFLWVWTSRIWRFRFFRIFLSFGEMWILEWDKAAPRSLATTILTRPMSVEPQNEGWEKSQSPWRITRLRQNWGLRPAVFSERILNNFSKLWRNKYDFN